MSTTPTQGAELVALTDAEIQSVSQYLDDWGCLANPLVVRLLRAAALRSPGQQAGEPSEERAAFEAWAAEAENWKPIHFARSIVNGNYSWGALNLAWRTWQARAALSQARVSIDIREDA